MLRSSSGSIAPHFIRSSGSPVSQPNGKVLPPPPGMRSTSPNRSPENASWTARLLNSVKETVFGDDEEGSDDDYGDSPPHPPGKRRSGNQGRSPASTGDDGESDSDESDSPQRSPAMPSRGGPSRSPLAASRKPPGPDTSKGGLIVITPEMRAAGGTIFRSPTGVNRKVSERDVNKGK